MIGGVLGLIAIMCLITYCYRRRRGHPSQSNQAFVSENSGNGRNRTYQTYEDNYFKNGIWLSRYHQYGQWNGPHRMSLSFDRSSSRVTGHGCDNIGKFTADGTFSEENGRIAINKVYELDTGDSRENFGHTVALQLTWNPSHGQFEGKWFVQTNHYRGEGQFELKLEDSSGSLLEKRAD